MAAVRCDLEDLAAEMFEPFSRADQRRWGQVYLRGLLLDGRRKSVEPMAARLGEDGNRQALANFITTSPWDAAHVRARLAWRMQHVIKPTALIVDDTGFLKDGDASACVACAGATRTHDTLTSCLTADSSAFLPLRDLQARASNHHPGEPSRSEH